MTSNIGARLITEKRALGFMAKTDGLEAIEYEKNKKEVLSELKKDFKPEFINRIDEVIVFHKLLPEEIIKIADIMLKQIEERLKEKKIEILVDEKAKKLIVEKGTDLNYGARPLKRTIQTMIEDKIAEEIIANNIKEGEKVKITEENGNIIVEK